MGWAVCDGSTVIVGGLTQMKIAVTGAGGFIGKYVLAELKRHAVEVVAVAREAVSLANHDGAVQVIEMDVCEAGADSYERLGCPDVLIHLAWGELSNYKSIFHIESELPMHCRFLTSLVEAGLPALLVTGTCLEYGLRSGELQEEDELSPVVPYGFAKAELLKQLKALQSRCRFSFTWARLFYMYGDGQSKNSLFMQLKQAVDRGSDIFDMSGGEQLRDYLPVEDAAYFIVMLALSKVNAVVNVCSGKPISVRRLVEEWLDRYGWSISLNLGHYPYPDYEPMAFWGSAARLHEFVEQK